MPFCSPGLRRAISYFALGVKLTKLDAERLGLSIAQDIDRDCRARCAPGHSHLQSAGVRNRLTVDLADHIARLQVLRIRSRSVRRDLGDDCAVSVLKVKEL